MSTNYDWHVPGARGSGVTPLGDEVSWSPERMEPTDHVGKVSGRGFTWVQDPGRVEAVCRERPDAITEWGRVATELRQTLRDIAALANGRHQDGCRHGTYLWGETLLEIARRASVAGGPGRDDGHE